MPRIARIIVPGLAHHITQRGNNRQIIFEEGSDYLQYCCWISKYASRANLEVLAYCLMPNHVHFIVIPKDRESISTVFHVVHMRYAQYMHKKREASGHLWQGRFYSCPMNERHVYRAIRYVEKNPVRSQIVKKAWQYPWSSAKWHAGLIKTPDICLKDTELIERDRWKEYLAENDEDFELINRGQVLKHLSPVNNYSNRISSR